MPGWGHTPEPRAACGPCSARAPRRKAGSRSMLRGDAGPHWLGRRPTRSRAEEVLGSDGPGPVPARSSTSGCACGSRVQVRAHLARGRTGGSLSPGASWGACRQGLLCRRTTPSPAQRLLPGPHRGSRRQGCRAPGEGSPSASRQQGGRGQTLRARGSRDSATVARPPPHPAGCHLGVTARGTRAYGPAAASPPAPPLLPDGGEARLGQGGHGPRQQPRAARRTPTGGRSRLPAALARPDEDLEVSLVLCEFVLCSSSATFGRICDGIGDQDPRPGPALSAA